MCACVHTKSLQSCPTLCNPMDCSPPGSSVHGILQKKTGVGCHALVHGIFQTLGLNPCLLCLLQWQAGSLPLVPSSKTDFCTFLFFLFFLCLCKVTIWLPYSPIVRVVVRELYLWWPLQIWEEVNLLIYPSFIWLLSVEHLLCAKHCSRREAAAVNGVPFLKQAVSPENLSTEFRCFYYGAPVE